MTPVFESYMFTRFILASMLGCLFVKSEHLNAYFIGVGISVIGDAAIYIAKL